MSTFQGIERRIKDECGIAGERRADEMVKRIAQELGYNISSTWWASDEFLYAVKPLKQFAAQRFSKMEFQRVWGEAEKAALDVLKKGGAA